MSVKIIEKFEFVITKSDKTGLFSVGYTDANGVTFGAMDETEEGAIEKASNFMMKRSTVRQERTKINTYTLGDLKKAIKDFPKLKDSQPIYLNIVSSNTDGTEDIVTYAIDSFGHTGINGDIFIIGRDERT